MDCFHDAFILFLCLFLKLKSFSLFDRMQKIIENKLSSHFLLSCSTEESKQYEFGVMMTEPSL